MTPHLSGLFLDDAALCSRVEDAGLNATAPPQQRWLDGWLLRFSPGQAKRARCINAVAAGRTSLDEKLRVAMDLYRSASLPIIVRITPFSQPHTLDADLATAGFMRENDATLVMISRTLPSATAGRHPLPAGFAIERVGTHNLAHAAGQLRGSPLAHRQAHAQRLELSPVPWASYLVRREADGATVACGQTAVEGDLIGVYDVITATDARRQGVATALCEHMLVDQQQHQSVLLRSAYLQVEANNDAARRIYVRLGFANAFEYHYRSWPGPSEVGPSIPSPKH